MDFNSNALIRDMTSIIQTTLRSSNNMPIPRRNKRETNHRFNQENKDMFMRYIKIFQGHFGVRVTNTTDIPVHN